MRVIGLAIGLAAAAAAPPNMVFMLLDDVGWGDIDLGLHPGSSPATTPNFRAMAASPHSVVFRRFYSGGAVCSPTRSTMLTGRTPTRECVINVEQNALPLVLNQSTTAAVARAHGYATGFFGKHHLGSLIDPALFPDQCYTPNATQKCFSGYVQQPDGRCCDGQDALTPIVTPADLGFETVLATSQVSPTSNANCGCVYSVPQSGQNCNIGHYAGAGHDSPGPYIECDQYATFNASAGSAGSARQAQAGRPAMQPVDYVTPVDDSSYLGDAFEAFVRQAVAGGKPFLAHVHFHNCHVPYISPPEFRAPYAAAGFDLNHQDYYGCLSAADAQAGRIRSLLQELGVAGNTFLSLASDNGPELSIGGHDCAAFFNPGSTAGLTGRKRALTEGGIRIPGVIEFPPLVQANRVEEGYWPASTMDYLPTLLDALGLPSDRLPVLGWPVDGASLLPVLAGTAANRSTPIGWHSDFNWQLSYNGTNASCQDRGSPAPPPSMPANFTTPFNQTQLAWTEGPLKLFACRGPVHWRWSLYDVVADPAEQEDLWPTLGNTTGDALFRRFYAWQQDVERSVAEEDRCVIGGGRGTMTVMSA